MMTMTTLIDIWTSITPEEGRPVGRLVDANHPLDFYAAYDEEGYMQFGLFSTICPLLPSSSKSVAVKQTKRPDGTYYIGFSLLEDRLKEQFVYVCQDMLKSTESCDDIEIGTRTAVNCFVKWQHLFAKEQITGMSDQAVKGLIGELLVLNNICFEKYGIQKAINGWVGPWGADRDFDFGDCWYESKCIGFSREEVSISSFEQLDTDKEGFLVLSRVEKGSPTVETNFSLNSLVEELAGLIPDLDTRTEFTCKLLSYGYNKDALQADVIYEFSSQELYLVDSSFPALRRSEVTPEIVNGSYKISIPAIQAWKQP